ncbi:copper-containing nitrite reductase [Fusarium flagelliforme]|uniref:Copper-containing nitrite reductase n=1 Tax=Fusarium flagelliforme TaxID=2675880 RepID=A0A395MH09_9HYPO|nr:copper-containing nitrite reductase [Fusarium flagelliforme]
MTQLRIPLARCRRSCPAARQLSLLGSRGAIATIAYTSFTLPRRSRKIPATGTRAFSSASQANKRRNSGFTFSLGAVTAFLSLSVYLYHSDTGLPSIVLAAVRGGREPISKAVEFDSAGDGFQDISSRPKEVAVLTSAPNVPPSITRKHPVLLQVELATETKLAQLTSQYKYEQWTFNGTVPGPFIRARVGDVVELTLTNKDPTGNPHNIDCHAFTGPGGGAAVTTVEENESKTARFKLLYPGLYFYHCAAAPVPVHIANGMYGLMYVQPEEDLPSVDKEYYVMQSEFYHEPPEIDDDGRRSDTVEFSYPNGLREEPNVIVFNGSESALTRDKPLKANVGDSVRIFFGNAGPNLTSAFHVIGSHFKKVYRDGDVISPPGRAIQTITVPPGSASIVDLKMLVPGTYSLIDHAMFRLDKGAVGFLNVSGKPEPNVYESEQPPKPCVGRKLHA